ncbi:YjdJ family protein [Psychrobacillus sp.]|uniref:YjdJ family protein n=1 Tax=Psychrobacillus sp. TaxID=1871623 RepID=UPI0028BD5F7B|nr:YjdJ family protein [Psychrobacillus sp.]
MSFKVMLQLCTAAMIFIFATVAAWYEGSQIREVSWEWKYTTIFSELINGPVKQPSDILPIDHFVYAAKFAPTFPLLMFLSGTYILILQGFLVFRHNKEKFSYFLSTIGVLFLGLSSFLSNSPTTGLKIFFNSFLIMGILIIGVVLFRLTRMKTKEI